MGKINVLGFDVANLIAAGEVVDRPASIVKELVENAVDSGADSITVEIKNGGISHIRVSDNGCGMDRDDLPLAVLRHATSKIKSADDLDSILTLGFRGEALAAIASVTKLKIYTRSKDSEEGSYMICDGGEIVDLGETSCAKGTTVIADELFYNVPARRKFLKRDATECAKITEIMEKIALSVPDISVKYVSDGQIRFMTQGDGNLKNAIHSVFGKAAASRMIPVKRTENGVSVTGYVSEPDMTFSKRSQEIYYVNGRYIRSPLLMSAIERAYVSKIPSDKFPMCVLNIHLTPSAVDVNVHPTKLEVKFSNERTVAEAVHYAVLTALNTTETRPQIKIGNVYGSDEYAHKASAVLNAKASVDKSEKTDKQLPLGDLSTGDSSHSALPNKASDASPTHKVASKNETGYQEPKFGGVTSILAGYDIPEFISKPKSSSLSEAFEQKNNISRNETDKQTIISESNEPKNAEPTGGNAISAVGDSRSDEYAVSLTSDTVGKNDEIPDYKIIGEAYDCYVIVQLEDRLLMIDKHAAHERIIFDELCRRRKEKDKESQLLLAPIEVFLQDDELTVIAEYEDDIRSIGFDFTPAASDRKVSITKIPVEISPESAPDAFCAIAARLSEGQNGIEIAEAELFERALYQASCKAAIKGGKHYGIEHIKWICSRLLKKPDKDGRVIKTCPHGRPVAFEIKKSSIERQFSRIE